MPAVAEIVRSGFVEGHHYALVVVDGLESGGAWDYELSLDGVVVWTERGSPYPAPRIRTLDRRRPNRRPVSGS